MLFGFVDLNFSDYFTLRTNSTTRDHDYKLFLAYSRLNVRKHFFCQRVVPIWNNLECNSIDFSSTKWFKASLLFCDLNWYTHFKFSLVYVPVCFIYLLLTLNIVLWFVTHVSGHYWPFAFIMATLHSRCGHYIFALWFLLLSSFFPRLFSAVADWMSTILLHMVWP